MSYAPILGKNQAVRAMLAATAKKESKLSTTAKLLSFLRRK